MNTEAANLIELFKNASKEAMAYNRTREGIDDVIEAEKKLCAAVKKYDRILVADDGGETVTIVSFDVVGATVNVKFCTENHKVGDTEEWTEKLFDCDYVGSVKNKTMGGYRQKLFSHFANEEAIYGVSSLF